MSLESVEKPLDILARVLNLIGDDSDYDLSGRRKKSDTSQKVNSKKNPSENEQLMKELSTFSSQPLLKSYQLSADDVKSIALLWANSINNMAKTFSWYELCDKIGLNKFQTNKCLDYIRSLCERRIIFIEDLETFRESPDDFDILENDIKLTKEIIVRILGRSIPDEIARDLSPAWENNQQFLLDLKLSLEKIFKCFTSCTRSKKGRVINTGTLHPDNLLDSLQPIIERLTNSEERLSIATTFRRYELDRREMIILLLVIYFDLILDDPIEREELLNLIGSDKNTCNGFSSHLHNDSKLFTNNLIEEGEAGLYECSSILRLTECFKKSLSSTSNTGFNTRETPLLDQILRSRKTKYFSIIETTQKIDDLILPDEDKKILERIIARYKRPDHHDLSRWGFSTAKTNSTDRFKGLILLFYGASGTGKTFAAGAIANELNKELVGINCAEFRQMYYGQTEKIVKRTFNQMHQIASGSNNPPLFLLNEAEQITHQRNEEAFKTDHTENAIQNIILEALESFPGFLILTTNLKEIIDDAYYRRFNIKMEFKKPDLKCRKQLWKIHLHDGIPGIRSIDIDHLAKSFQFTGGQIAIVVQNACLDAITRKGKEKRLKMEDLLKYACLEQPYQQASGDNRIGFISEKNPDDKKKM